MFSKIEVNGEGRHPLYQKLIAAAPTAVAPEESGFYARMVSKGRAPLYPDDILWNFEKFLVGRGVEFYSNSLPMVTIWNSAVKMKNIEVEGEKPLLEVLQYIENNDMRDDILMETAKQNQKPEYNFDIDILTRCWTWLITWTILYLVVTIIALERIDKDKR